MWPTHHFALFYYVLQPKHACLKLFYYRKRMLCLSGNSG